MDGKIYVVPYKAVCNPVVMIIVLYWSGFDEMNVGGVMMIMTVTTSGATTTTITTVVLS